MISVICADIATLDVDVIVNAANGSLLGGGGVDGAIHAAAGPGLLDECRRLPLIESEGVLDADVRCATGDAKVTSGHRLLARHVVHTVGPVWPRSLDSSEQGQGQERERQRAAELLASCYRRSCEEAVRVSASSIAFPFISTGVYGYPKGPAAVIAVRAVEHQLAVGRAPSDIVFCLFSEADRELFQRTLEARAGEQPAG